MTKKKPNSPKMTQKSAKNDPNKYQIRMYHKERVLLDFVRAMPTKSLLWIAAQPPNKVLCLWRHFHVIRKAQRLLPVHNHFVRLVRRVGTKRRIA